MLTEHLGLRVIPVFRVILDCRVLLAFRGQLAREARKDLREPRVFRDRPAPVSRVIRAPRVIRVFREQSDLKVFRARRVFRAILVPRATPARPARSALLVRRVILVSRELRAILVLKVR